MTLANRSRRYRRSRPSTAVDVDGRLIRMQEAIDHIVHRLHAEIQDLGSRVTALEQRVNEKDPNAMTESESQELDGLKHRVVMAMGRQIADIMENGRKDEHPTAADFAVALKWLHDEKSDGTAAGSDNPIAAAIEQIRSARHAGGRMLASDDECG